LNKRLYMSIFAVLLAFGPVAHVDAASAGATVAPTAAIAINSPASSPSDPAGSPPPASSAAELSAESTKQQPATPKAKVKINGSLVTFSDDYPAVIRDNRMFVPIRMFEHADIQAQITIYDTPDETNVLIRNFHAFVQMVIGQEEIRYYVYETDQNFNASSPGMAPYRESREVMVPIRPVAEALGFEVLWDQQERAALLQSDEAYRANLHTRSVWEDWLGELPAEEAYETVEAITDEEIAQYIRDKKLNILDYKHLSDYKTLVLEVRGDEMSAYAIQRTRNGNLKSEDVTYWTKADAKGFFVKRFGGYVGIAVHDQAVEYEIAYAVVNFFDLQGKAEPEKVTFEPGQKGKLIKLPANITSGIVRFYGQESYLHESRFW